jgi:hypothetical protein
MKAFWPFLFFKTIFIAPKSRNSSVTKEVRNYDLAKKATATEERISFFYWTIYCFWQRIKFSGFGQLKWRLYYLYVERVLLSCFCEKKKTSILKDIVQPKKRVVKRGTNPFSSAL